jgi:ribosomal protein L11 methyltransferase
MRYFQITIPTADPAIQEILVAQLSVLGYEGFEQQDDAILAYIPESASDTDALTGLLLPLELGWSSEQLEEKNWNEEWERNFQPVVVEGFCGIRAHFHDPAPGLEHDLVITPKMSFGTGHHATTYLMIQEMRHLVFAGKRVLDFGTGTGVLAILAEQRGAREVIAVDYDEWSIDNALENIAANACFRILTVRTDIIPSPGLATADPAFTTPFDIILANINKQVILQQLPAVGQQLKEGGVILLSGLLLDDEPELRKAASENNLSISVAMTKGSWICLKGEKKTK